MSGRVSEIGFTRKCAHTERGCARAGHTVSCFLMTPCRPVLARVLRISSGNARGVSGFAAGDRRS